MVAAAAAAAHPAQGPLVERYRVVPGIFAALRVVVARKVHMFPRSASGREPQVATNPGLRLVAVVRSVKSAVNAIRTATARFAFGTAMRVPDPYLTQWQRWKIDCSELEYES